mmetsp:Transcript_4099/g.13344  ORF Transcript_4099/g.13344 Transcript_4099/m.13344 type:complete len:259 (-) Transcript_4099:679-1455(-)
MPRLTDALRSVHCWHVCVTFRLFDLGDGPRTDKRGKCRQQARRRRVQQPLGAAESTRIVWLAVGGGGVRVCFAPLDNGLFHPANLRAVRLQANLDVEGAAALRLDAVEDLHLLVSARHVEGNEAATRLVDHVVLPALVAHLVTGVPVVDERRRLVPRVHRVERVRRDVLGAKDLLVRGRAKLNATVQQDSCTRRFPLRVSGREWRRVKVAGEMHGRRRVGHGGGSFWRARHVLEAHLHVARHVLAVKHRVARRVTVLG